MDKFVEEIQQIDSEEQQQAAEKAAEVLAEQDAQVEDSAETEVSVENLEEIEQKRSIVNNDAEKHRRLRDELNNQTKD